MHIGIISTVGIYFFTPRSRRPCLLFFKNRRMVEVLQIASLIIYSLQIKMREPIPEFLKPVPLHVSASIRRLQCFCTVSFRFERLEIPRLIFLALRRQPPVYCWGAQSFVTFGRPCFYVARESSRAGSFTGRTGED